MTAKTYGQVLLDAMEQETDFNRSAIAQLSLVSDATFERCARAVILEFVRRVEFKASEIVASGDFEDPPYTYSVTTAEAFDMLHSELQEAK